MITSIPKTWNCAHNREMLQQLMDTPEGDRGIKDNIDLTNLLAEEIKRSSEQKVYDSLVQKHGTVLKQHAYDEEYITQSCEANLVWCTSRYDGSFGTFEVVRLPEDGKKLYFSWSRDDIRDEQTS